MWDNHVAPGRDTKTAKVRSERGKSRAGALNQKGARSRLSRL
jgi:hypothetical protein